MTELIFKQYKLKYILIIFKKQIKFFSITGFVFLKDEIYYRKIIN